MPSAAENHEINWIGNMPTFSISEYNKSLLSNCRAKKMYAMVENISRNLKFQYVGTCKKAYTKGYALNRA